MKRSSQEQHQSRLEAIKESLRIRSANIVSRTVKRSSAQRITLFKHDNVGIFNGELSIPAIGPDSKSESQKYYQLQHNSKLGAKLKSKKPLTLLALGPIEIYEIKTNKSGSKYLTVGKRDSNIIHPLLPRLRIVKYDGIRYCYFVAFSNPSRFWRIEFLNTGRQDCNLDSITEEFEAVIKRVCQLLEIRNDTSQGVDDYGDLSSGNLDELNYLLDDSDDDYGGWYRERLARVRRAHDKSKSGRDSASLVEFSDQRVIVHQSVNAEFQKVMSHLRRPLDFESPSHINGNLISSSAEDMSRSQTISTISSIIPDKQEFYSEGTSSSALSDRDTLVSSNEC